MKESMYRLKSMLCDELDEIAGKGELSSGDLETIHKLTDTIKNIDKIEALEGEGYSGGDRMPYGRYSGSRHYVRGHYTRGHYSMAEGKARIADRIEEMMQDDDLTTAERSALERAIDALR